MEFVSGNIFIREMVFEKAGDVVEGHKHNFDHTTYVARGALLIEALDADGSVIRTIEKRADMGRNFVLIRAGVCHRITALADNSLGHCIYSHRSPKGDVVEHWDGWPEAYR
jgi:quercetin dioxygenase-like cupin family protein